ncbi:toxin-antitoxin system YwqK family antitoxin [Fusobacterium animalis]|uniref:toxin-antitoxin system YwqK family antitoxin n=1 Tax=Fusobacterium animalis TaxID=76859 RepID=UPI0030CC93FF
MFFLIFIFLFFFIILSSITHISKSLFYLKKMTLISLILFTGISFSTYTAEEIEKKENTGFFGTIKEIDEKITNFLDSIKDYKANSVGFFETEIPANEVFITSDNFIVYDKDRESLVSGVVTERDEQGNMISATKVKNGLVHGKYREYYPPYDEHILKREGKFKNGALNGKNKTYYENGEVESIIVFSGGIPDGTFKEYYRNGELKSKGKYEKGKKTGKWTYYHQSGEKESEGKYKNDEKIKVWKYYDNNGNLKDEVRHSFL